MDALFVVTNADHLDADHPTGVWLEEFAVPWVALCEGGISLTVASPTGGPAPVDPKSEVGEPRRSRWAKAVEALGATVPLAEVADKRADLIFFPGGHGPLMDLAGNPDVAELVSAYIREGRLVAALCHGPAALLDAKSPDGSPLVRNRKITAFTDGEERLAGLASAVPFLLEERLKSLGARFETALAPGLGNVVRDENLITGQNPASSEAMARALLEALAQRQRAALEASATPA